jgi:hypothetical protein
LGKSRECRAFVSVSQLKPEPLEPFNFRIIPGGEALRYDFQTEKRILDANEAFQDDIGLFASVSVFHTFLSFEPVSRAAYYIGAALQNVHKSRVALSKCVCILKEPPSTKT